MSTTANAAPISGPHSDPAPPTNTMTSIGTSRFIPNIAGKMNVCSCA